MTWGNRLAIGLLLAGTAGATFADPVFAKAAGDEAAVRFGTRENVLDISLSPSGEKIAFISAGPEHGEILSIIDLSTDATVRRILANSEIIADLDSCEWADDERLVCSASGMADVGDLLIPFDRLFAVEAASGKVTEISRRQRGGESIGFSQQGGSVLALDVGGEQGKILMASEAVPEMTTGTRLANDDEGLGVELVDIRSGARRNREKPDPGATRFVADDAGRVRIKVRARFDGAGRLTGNYEYLYRPTEGGVWKALENLTIDGQRVPYFSPAAVDAARDVTYGFTKNNGYDAIAEFPLDGTGKGRLVLARSDVDVDSLIRIGRQRRVVGASYATEKRQIAYFDPALARLARDLAAALPNRPLINLVGASAD
ncbi:MAG: acylaminoacyl-peptidase, partial [Porphyrobacter sp. HL-46]